MPRVFLCIRRPKPRGDPGLLLQIRPVHTLQAVTDYHAADELLERIRALDPRFHERAYLFVLAALEYCQQRRPERGHITGQELARGCREFALDQFGLMARSVLSHWGILKTEDIGRIVFLLIEAGLLMKQESDRMEDFDAVFDFVEAFEGNYLWRGVPGVIHAERRI